MARTILAFDPGSAHTGWAALSHEPLVYIDSGTFSLGKGEFYDRIVLLKEKVQDLLLKVQPCVIVLESVFIGVNRDSGIKLAQTRGALMALCADRQVEFAQYSPRQAKQMVTGYGAATKEQVAIMMERLLKRSFKCGSDETDALALALCHYFTEKQKVLRQVMRR